MQSDRRNGGISPRFWHPAWFQSSPIGDLQTGTYAISAQSQQGVFVSSNAYDQLKEVKGGAASWTAISSIKHVRILFSLIACT
jgi:hypothetical protein